MSESTSAPPSKRIINHGQSENRKISAYQAISVTLYADGSARVSHARLDLSSNRMVFTPLSSWDEPQWEDHSPERALAYGAAEHLDDALRQDALW
jgi:hypothetical protein